MQTLEKIPDFLLGGGEMGERIRNFDWSKTALGPPQYWDQSLKTSVSICLNSNFPIALYWGKELVLIYNDAWSPIPGNKNKWALGKPAKEVWADIWNEIEPEFKKAFDGIPGGSKDALLPMQRHGYTEECYFDFTFTPVRGSKGDFEGIFNAVIETTYRVINERRSMLLNDLSLLLTSVETQKEIFEKLNDFFKRNIKTISFAFFYSQNDGIFQLIASTHNSEDAKLKKPFPLEQSIEEKKIILIQNLQQYFYNIPKGFWEEEPAEAVILPIVDINTNVSHYIICGLNARHRYDADYNSFFQSLSNLITKSINTIASLEEERKRAEALAEIDKAKTLFFTNISHEFRTPLTLMLGPLEEALKDPNINSADQTRLDVAYRNAMRLLKLVNTLLDFSRIESGRQKASFVQTDIVSFTKNLASNFRSVIEKAGLKLSVKADETIQPVYIDREMWEKIVFNLLSNAFKYTLEGSITVELSTEKDYVLLKVKDTGVGIPENELPNMFERFHRVQNTTGRTFEGTGIGLSLTKELVQLHGGAISVESKQGAGSTFTISIPFGKEHLPSSQIKNEFKYFEDVLSDLYVEEATTLLQNVSAKNKLASTIHENGNKSFPVVMIVDDNADMRQHLQTLLITKFRTLTGNNGIDALHKLQNAKPDLIISDVMMPEMDGIQLLKEIKNNKETDQIPVILLTARAGEESKIEGWETGADDYLVKPFSARELIARIDAQIKIKQKHKRALQSVYNLFDEVPFAVAVLKGESLIIEYANKYTLAIWQRKKEEVLGKPMFEVLPETRAGAEHVHKEVYKSGKRFIANELPVEVTTDNKTETRYFNSVIDPMFDEQNEIIGQLATTIEITDAVVARKKIEKSEKELTDLANAMPQLVWIAEPDGKIIYYNERVNEFAGVKKLADKSWSWEGLVHKDDVDETTKAWSKAINTGNVYEIDHRFQMKDGSYRWHLSRALPQKDEDGNIVKWFGTATDIHEQKESEEKIKESETRFRFLFDSNVLGVAFWNVDGTIYDANNAFLNLLGYAKEDMYEGKINWRNFSLPEDALLHEEKVLQAIERKLVAPYETRYTHKNGSVRPALVGYAMLEGSKEKGIAFIQDFSKIKEAEIALRESEERFRTLAETLPQMVWVRNIEGIIEYASKSWEEYSGIKNISEAWRIMVHPDDWKAIMNAWEKATQTGKSFRYEVRLKNKNGEYRWHYATGEPAKDQTGKVVKWIGALTDIQVQKTFAEKLELEVAQRTEDLVKANKELESFNYIASHDLQEPLRKIQTFITIIEKNKTDNNVLKKYFEKINLSAQRMSDLIQSILSYSRLSKTDDAIELTDLNQILHNVETDFELLIKEKNAVIKSGVLPVIKANALQMQQLFANLISNSLKFSDHNPEIEISSKIVSNKEIEFHNKSNPHQKFSQLTFSDNGIGFDPVFKDQIFQLFQRLHNKADYSGTGIGLSIVKKIVENHDGYIMADSTPGKGSAFIVWLPLE